MAKYCPVCGGSRPRVAYCAFRVFRRHLIRRSTTFVLNTISKGEIQLANSPVSELCRKIVDDGLKIFGLELRRIPTEPLPRMFRSPLQAMLNAESGTPTSVEVEISSCVAINGMSFGPEAFHFFVPTVNEYLNSGHSAYIGSHLHHYYTTWKPANAQESLICSFSETTFLAEYPSHLLHIPWNMLTPGERLLQLEQTIQRESERYGNIALNVSDGMTSHGPTTIRKGELEFRRLIDVVKSIQRQGYDRLLGDIDIEVLKRGSELRFRVLHGQHRVAALSGLGYSTLPCRPRILVDVEKVDEWPQVKLGTWKKQNAIDYFNHLFDFDSRAWAGRLGLLR